MKPRRSVEPHDRLTHIGAVMTDALEAHPEYREADRCVIFLSDGERAGMILNGYGDDDRQAMADVFVHMAAVFEANGMTLKMIPLRGGPSS